MRYSGSHMAEDLAILSQAVADIDGREIAPGGAMVGKSLLAAVANKGGGASQQSAADAGLLEDASKVYLDTDLAPLFEGDMRKRLLAVIAKIVLPEPVARELNAMRQTQPILYNHSVATMMITTRLAMEIVVKAEDLARIGRATLLKDIGMTRVAQPLKQNRDYLNRQEFHQIRKHPVLGLLINTYYLGEGIEGMVALRHHMRNGAGYPQWAGLKPSRLIDIVEAVDIFYALISPRSFRPQPFDVRGALDEMTTMTNKGELNTEAVRLLVSCFRADRPDLSQINLSNERLGFVPESNFYGTGPQ